VEAARYDKAHLFSYVNEDRYMEPGEMLVHHEAPWGHVGCAICYDVRFPEVFRTYALQGVELVFCPAAFPHPRLEHWRTLLRARAIENQLFIVATNQVGHESFGIANRLEYFGHSLVVDPWGEILVEGPEEETLLSTAIDLRKASEIRAKMTILNDRRPGLYKLD